MRNHDESPTKYAGLMNTDRVRNPIVDNRMDDDGFWFYGYGNDPKRRRHVRHVENHALRALIEHEVSEFHESQAQGT